MQLLKKSQEYGLKVMTSRCMKSDNFSNIFNMSVSFMSLVQNLKQESKTKQKKKLTKMTRKQNLIDGRKLQRKRKKKEKLRKTIEINSLQKLMRIIKKEERSIFQIFQKFFSKEINTETWYQIENGENNFLMMQYQLIKLILVPLKMHLKKPKKLE